MFLWAFLTACPCMLFIDIISLFINCQIKMLACLLACFGTPSPKEEKTHPGHRRRPTIMQHFTPIGAIVAEISVTGQTNNQTANLIAFQTNTWRVNIQLFPRNCSIYVGTF